MAEAVAIVGGTGGLGEAVTRHLGQAGTPLAIGYHRNEDKAQALVADIEAAGGRAIAAQIDIREPAAVDGFVTSSAEALGGLSGFINVTGPPIPLKPLVDIPAEEFWAIMETDVLGAYNVLTSVSRHFAAQGGGSIVHFLTTAVLRTLENDGMSGIPKTAVMGIIRQLAREVGQQNVRINAIAPGVMNVGIVHSSFATDEVAKGVIDLCLQRTPMPRMGSPEEAAELAAFLVGGQAGYVNGQIIGIDGGYSA